MKTKQQKLVIFDFDGVIVDSMSTALEVLRLFRPEITEDQFKKRFHGNIAKSNEENPLYSDSDFYAEYIPRVEKLSITAEVAATITTLAQKYDLSVVSSSRADSIERFLNVARLRSHFSNILGIETHPSKVVKFRSLLDKHDLQPSDCVLITDTLGDIREANEVGIPSIGVLWGLHDEPTLQEGKPAHVAAEPQDLIEQVKDILKT